MFKNIAIIMPCHGKSLMTRMCIESIYNQVDCSPLHIVVCDNYSPDDTWPVLTSQNKYVNEQTEHQMTILNNGDPDNFGPAKGNNFCLAVCTDADLVIRVDNDTIFPTRFFGRFIEHANRRMAEHSNIGVFCARPLEQDNFGHYDSDPKKPLIDDAPLGRWYYSHLRRGLQNELSENSFFTEEQVNRILNIIYTRAKELTDCAPTMNGYHEWIFTQFFDRYDLYPGGFTPALYAWTRDAVLANPWHDDITFTHSDLEDNDYMYLIARLGFTTCTFHDLFFHHWGSFTREYTGRNRAVDGMIMSELFKQKWDFLNENPENFISYIEMAREKVGLTMEDYPDVPNPAALTNPQPVDLDDYVADDRKPQT